MRINLDDPLDTSKASSNTTTPKYLQRNQINRGVYNMSGISAFKMIDDKEDNINFQIEQ